GSQRPMERVAVEFDDHLFPPPQSIDLVALDDRVQLRPRDVVVVAEVEEVTLPVRVEARRLAGDGGDGCPEARDSAPAWMARIQLLDRNEVKEPEPFRLLDQ